LGWEHVNLTGDYIWDVAQPMTENNDGLMPFRTAPQLDAKAA
jgi:predicted small integral membrane protein